MQGNSELKHGMTRHTQSEPCRLPTPGRGCRQHRTLARLGIGSSREAAQGAMWLFSVTTSGHSRLSKGLDIEMLIM